MLNNFFELVEKFDEAEATVVSAQAALYSQKFVNGCVHAFEHSNSGLHILYGDLREAALQVRVGDVFSGYLGKLIGGL